MEFLVLGPLEVRRNGRTIALSGPKQRALLAILLLHANEVVSSDRLIDDLWGDEPPRTGHAALQMRVSALRKVLDEHGLRRVPSNLLITRTPGYLLHVEPDELDATRFERMLAAGRSLRDSDPQAGADALREALAIWRGDPLADLADEPFAQAEIARLVELRASAIEERIAADLDLGGHAAVIGELEAHVAAYPLRERPRAQLMVALYRSGRQAEALAVFHAIRRALVDEFGVEPGSSLQLLERQILQQDPILDVRPGEPAVASGPDASLAPERRKTVTVAVTGFFERTGHLEVDPEHLRRIGQLYGAAASSVYEQHGGVIESSSSSHMVAVFGDPVLHEDDALRAVRAASTLDRTLSAIEDDLERGLGVRRAVRTGVATGEVITGGSARGLSSLEGEPMILAGQLQQLAGARQILLSESTRRMTERAVTVEPVEVVDSVTAWRLVQVGADLPIEIIASEAALIGRANELGQLRLAYERAARDRTLHLCTVVGTAGIGKSRLARAFVSEVAGSATVAIGRCLAYGQGITFWPVREIVRQLAPHDHLLELLRGEADAQLVAERISGAVGLANTGGSVEETFWAVRRLFEVVARERPLVIVIEDIHWAEPTLLVMLEYLAARARGAQIILLCLARPELLEGRPGFGAGAVNATSILLEPLADDESRALIDERLGSTVLDPVVRRRINETADGNPLFLEQLVAMVTQQRVSDGELPIPPTIQALVAARVDRVDPRQRVVLERAAVIGREFSLAALVELLPGEARARAPRDIEALVLKDFLQSDPSRPDGEQTFRFRHVLIQQAAYRSIPKELRADAHEAFANWLESNQGSLLAEIEEILGYHLEQAFQFRAEVGPTTDRHRDLARRGGAHLASAGRRAFKAGDMPASVNLLGRAAALLAPLDAGRLDLLTDLGFAFFEIGGLERSSEILAEVVAEGTEIGARQAVARATVQRAHVEMYRHPQDVDQPRLLRDAAKAVAVLRAVGDDAGMARASLLESEVQWTLGSGLLATQAAVRAARYSRRAGSRREEAWSHGDYGYYAVFGPATVAEGTRRMERWLDEAGGDPVLEANLTGFLAPLAAMLGRIPEARERLAESRVATERLGLRWQTGTHDLLASVIEMLADDPVAANAHLRQGIQMFDEMGDMWFLSILSIELARALLEQGRDQDAIALVAELDSLAVDSSLSYRIRRADVLGRLVARRGDTSAALVLAREAVVLAERTDFLGFHADALTGLAEVLRLDGELDGAVDALGSAIVLLEQKGNIVEVEKVRTKRQALLGSSA